MPINKEKLRRMIPFAVFALGLFVMLGTIHRVTVRKDSREKLGAFYEEAGNIDVLFTGISQMETAVSPLELYQNYGITSFNFGEKGNQLPTSYWVIANALDYADPELVVVDVRKIEDDSVTYSDLTTTSFDSVPLSLTKIRTALDLFDTWEERLDFLFPLLRYHTRWTELEERDFTGGDGRLDMGASHYEDRNLKVAVPAGWSFVPAEKREVTGSLSEQYLRRLVSMCKERGIDVLLLNLPSPADKQTQLYSNGVITIAQELDVPYLDLLHEEDFFNFDTDMNDARSHLNDSGAHKVTEFLGRYLTEHYDLPDRRQDERCASWEKRLAEYLEYQYIRIGRQKKADNYLMLLSGDETGKCIYIREGSEILSDNRMQQLIQNMAGDTPLELLFEAALEAQSYFLLVDSEDGGVFECKGAEGLETDTQAFGHVIYSFDTEGNPVLYLEGEQDNYLDAVTGKTGKNADLFSVVGASWTSEVQTAVFQTDRVTETVLSATRK